MTNVALASTPLRFWWGIYLVRLHHRLDQPTNRGCRGDYRVTGVTVRDPRRHLTGPVRISQPSNWYDINPRIGFTNVRSSELSGGISSRVHTIVPLGGQVSTRRDFALRQRDRTRVVEILGRVRKGVGQHSVSRLLLVSSAWCCRAVCSGRHR